MRKYQNVAFASDRSAFIDVVATQATEATFTGKSVKASISGKNVPMIRGGVRLAVESNATICGEVCDVPVVEPVELKYSVLAGATNLLALKAEVDRLFTDALDNYALTKGTVPPVYATFSDP